MARGSALSEIDLRHSQSRHETQRGPSTARSNVLDPYLIPHPYPSGVSAFEGDMWGRQLRARCVYTVMLLLRVNKFSRREKVRLREGGGGAGVAIYKLSKQANSRRRPMNIPLPESSAKIMLGKRVVALSWSQLSPLAARWSAPPDPTSGPTSAQSRLRLFGAKESDVRVTLYRDNHAWCAYIIHHVMYIQHAHSVRRRRHDACMLWHVHCF